MKHSIIALICISFLAGCNTTRGIGRDLQSLGGGMKETARDIRAELNTDEEEVDPLLPKQSASASKKKPYTSYSSNTDYSAPTGYPASQRTNSIRFHSQ